MEKENQMIDLEKSKKEIKRMEAYIKRANKYEQQLETLKPKYFNDYFNLQRPLYEELKDIPSANYLNGEDNLMSKYSAFNLEDLGEIMVDYIEKEFSSKAKSEIKIVSTKERGVEDYQFYWYNQQTPHLFVYSTDIFMDIPMDVNNRGIENLNSNETIKCLNNDWLDEYYYYTYYCQLINCYSKYYNEYGELTFDYKNNKSIRELIYNLAYYQKQIDQIYLPEGELLKAYKKIYKR